MAAGDITGELDENVFTGGGLSCSVTKVSNDVIAIAYREGDRGGLRTFHVNDQGIISPLQYHQFESGTVVESVRILHIHGNIYAINYCRSDTLVMITVDIDSNGIITAIPGECITPGQCSGTSHKRMIHVYGNIYVMCQGYTEYASRLWTYNIDNYGVITGPVSHVEISNAKLPISLCKVINTKYAYCHHAKSPHRDVVRTFDISDTGHISGCLSEHLYAPVAGYDGDTVKVSDGVLAISLSANAPGVITTVGIADSGDITGNIATHYIGRTANHSNLIHCGGNVYAIVFNSGNPGYVYTIDIAESGVIAGNMSSWNIDNYCAYPALCHINENIYCAAYTGYGSVGTLKTFGIDTPSGAITARPPRFTTGLSHRSFH